MKYYIIFKRVVQHFYDTFFKTNNSHKKQSMKLRAISIFLTLLVTYNYISAEEIPHNSIIHGRWSVENSPYIVMGIAIVPEDSTLIIDPGVTVLLKSSTEYTDFYYETIGVGLIKVYGNIIAKGTETDSITFSRNQDGLWGSISILNSNERISEFKFCKFEYGSYVDDEWCGLNYYSGALGIENSNVNIYNSTYQYNGASIISGNSIIKINECLIKSNNSNGIKVYESNAQIKNNQLINNQIHGIASFGSTSEILNNLVANNGQYGIRSYESNDSIASNLIFDNQTSGIIISGGNAISYRNIIWGSNSGIRVNSGKPRIVNNTIVFNNYFGIYFGWQAQPYIVNSIFFGNQAMAYYNEQDTAIFAYSLLQSESLPSNFLNGGGNIFNLDPSFVDEHKHDFALSEDSPCIDSGAAFFIWEGDTIVQLSSEEYNDNAPDIGAIESEHQGTFVENNWIKSYRLNQNYPNPFYESTNIELNLIDCDEAYLVIYNLSGNAVKYFKIMRSGPQVISWDGNDKNGNILNGGIYIYRLYTKQGIYSKTMLMSR